ncbi:MAG: sulfotransferase family protein [Myxococcota bacterium]
MSEAGTEDSPPVFVVAVHRSGTTLLGNMLRGHPQLAFLGEFEYAVDFYADGAWPDPARLRDRLETDRRYRAQEFHVDPALGGRALMDDFLAQTRRRQGDKPRVGATFHRHFDRVAALWPEARLVHLVRDSRDVATSRIGMGWAGNAYSSAPAWRELEALWDRVAPGVADRAYELRYEDLVTSPEATLRPLCDFLGLDWEPEALLSYPSRSRYGPPDAGLAEQWRRKLAPRELALLEHAIGPMLRARGYPESGVPARAPGVLERAWLRVHDRWVRERFRIRRFGLPLLLASALANRTGPESLRRRLQQRIDAIITSQLR